MAKSASDKEYPTLLGTRKAAGVSSMDKGRPSSSAPPIDEVANLDTEMCTTAPAAPRRSSMRSNSNQRRSASVVFAELREESVNASQPSCPDASKDQHEKSATDTNAPAQASQSGSHHRASQGGKYITIHLDSNRTRLPRGCRRRTMSPLRPPSPTKGRPRRLRTADEFFPLPCRRLPRSKVEGCDFGHVDAELSATTAPTHVATKASTLGSQPCSPTVLDSQLQLPQQAVVDALKEMVAPQLAELTTAANRAVAAAEEAVKRSGCGSKRRTSSVPASVASTTATGEEEDERDAISSAHATGSSGGDSGPETVAGKPLRQMVDGWEQSSAPRHASPAQAAAKNTAEDAAAKKATEEAAAKKAADDVAAKQATELASQKAAGDAVAKKAADDAAAKKAADEAAAKKATEEAAAKKAVEDTAAKSS